MSLFQIPTQVFNFSEFHKRELFYVDRTKLIADTINVTNRFVWYLYPKGFGKTINLNMLYNFFDINHDFHVKQYYYVNNDKNILGLKNKIPVIYLNFTDTESISMNGFWSNFKKIINRALNYYPFIFSHSSEPADSKVYFQDLYDLYSRNEDYITAIKNLINRVARFYKLKVMLIIDGYDDLFLNAIRHQYFHQFSLFFNQFLSTTINGNTDIHKVIMGGVFPFRVTTKLKPTYITNCDPYSEVTPLEFSVFDASQMVINVIEKNTNPQPYIDYSVGNYTPTRKSISPRLLVSALEDKEIELFEDLFLSLFKQKDDPLINSTIVQLLRHQEVTLEVGTLKNVFLEEINENFESVFLMAMINYGLLHVIKGEGGKDLLRVKIPNSTIHRQISHYFYPLIIERMRDETDELPPSQEEKDSAIALKQMANGNNNGDK